MITPSMKRISSSSRVEVEDVAVEVDVGGAESA